VAIEAGVTDAVAVEGGCADRRAQPPFERGHPVQSNNHVSGPVIGPRSRSTTSSPRLGRRAVNVRGSCSCGEATVETVCPPQA
jgi:hypothetical protein